MLHIRTLYIMQLNSKLLGEIQVKVTVFNCHSTAGIAKSDRDTTIKTPANSNELMAWTFWQHMTLSTNECICMLPTNLQLVAT